MCDQLLLRVEGAAKRLGIGRSLAYRFIQSGELRSVKIGGARRVLVSDLEDFVKRLKEESDDDGGA
jgi:excisionase family DNA binding protein